MYYQAKSVFGPNRDKVAERMGFEISFYRLFHWFYGLKPALRLLAAAAFVMLISAQET
jgi:hypothetical protein